jgi:hypothetical protein
MDMRDVIRLYHCRKLPLLMLDPLEIRRGSQACEVSESFGECGLVWSFPKPPGPVPHSERLYSGSSRSADRYDAQLPRWFVVAETRNEKTVDDLEDASFTFDGSIGSLIEKATHVPVPLR